MLKVVWVQFGIDGRVVDSLGTANPQPRSWLVSDNRAEYSRVSADVKGEG